MARFICDFDDVGMRASFASAMFDSQIEDTIIDMLNSSSPILVDSMKTTLRSIVKESNSGAIKNIKAHKASKSKKTGNYIVYACTSGRTNHYYYNNGKKVPVYHDDALKWLEYGTEHQPARPWVEKATRRAEKAVISKMQSVYESRIGK